ncbi:AAA family ATPase [Mesoterricola silvestris]|uniref:AAA+ ATPase domain-containing protein n=1 Tax=Mesoterricola silvestris TaxID=2927979 RepID=A0AA48K7X4_9BACT|nr:AAA family ATPase [Mesoterricola silvestris]BDU71540.1 hypothetical protein METEAL_07140 [Mesoterricola silvestris]
MRNEPSPTERLFQAAKRCATASGHDILSIEDLALGFYGLQEVPQVETIIEGIFRCPRTAISWPPDLAQRWQFATKVSEDKIAAVMAYDASARKVLQAAFEGQGNFDLHLLAKGVLLSDTYIGQEMRRSNRPQRSVRSPESQSQSPAPSKSSPKQRQEAMRMHLQERILGQDGPVKVLVEAYYQSLHCPSSLGTKGLFTLLGPPGTGKSSLCRSFATGLEAIEGTHGFLVIDVGTYSADYSHDQLFGFSPSYRDAQPGLLTNFVKNNPDSVILLDELEKANPAFLQAILGLLDHGSARDNFHGQDIDFSRCWIMITSNLGQEFFREDKPRTWSRAQLLRLLDEASEPSRDEEAQGRRILSPELVSRLAKGFVLAMSRLTGSDLIEVFMRSARRKLEALKLPKLELGREEALLCLLAESRELDARKAEAQGDVFASRLVPDLLELMGQRPATTLRVTAGPAERALAKAKLDAVPLRIATRGSLAPFKAALGARALRFHELPEANGGDQPSLGRIDAVLLHLPRRCEPQWLDRLVGVPVLAMASPRVKRQMVAFHRPAAAWTWCSPRDREAVGRFLDSLRLDWVFREQARAGTTVTPHFLPLVREDGDLILRLSKAKETREAPCPAPGSRPHAMEFPQGGFDQLVGLEDAKSLLRVAVRLLQENHGSLPVPKGYLLTGPPGCGKTSLARSLAAESHLPFFSATPGDLASRYRDTASVRLRELFQEAARHAPAVLFLDELDAIGISRSTAMDADTHRCVTTLLTAMDGLQQRERPLLVLAATNHPELLDPALLRPGRFDGLIPLELPGVEEREAILRNVLSHLPTHGSLDLPDLAQRSFRSSAADLHGLVRMAVQWALRDGRHEITQADLEQALEWTQLGPRSSRKERTEDRRICAAHEAGHAVVQAKLRPDSKITRLDIISRANGTGGITQAVQGDGGLPTPRSIREDLAILLAGRAGEAMVSRSSEAITAGCSSDLERASHLARRAIITFGFDPVIGVISISEEILASTPALATQVQERVKVWISEGITLAEETLILNEHEWRQLVDLLLAHEVLRAPLIQDILRGP